MFQCRASENQVRVQEGRSQMLEYFFSLHIQEQMFRDMGEISEFCETEATDARTIDGEAIDYYYGLITRSPTERLNAAQTQRFPNQQVCENIHANMRRGRKRSEHDRLDGWFQLFYSILLVLLLISPRNLTKATRATF